jgi:hypothetical protein
MQLLLTCGKAALRRLCSQMFVVAHALITEPEYPLASRAD